MDLKSILQFESLFAEFFCNIVTFRNKIKWYNIGNMTSFDINFHFINFFTFFK